jgi:hypothetical protein
VPAAQAAGSASVGGDADHAESLISARACIPLEGLYRLYALAGKSALMRDARLLRVAAAPALHAASVLEAAVDALGQSLMALRAWDGSGHDTASLDSRSRADVQAAEARGEAERARRRAAELEAAEMAERLREATRDTARWKRRAEEAVRDALSTRAALQRLQGGLAD